MSEREQLWWDRAARFAALAGGLVAAFVFRIEAVAVYVFLAGLFFGPDAYRQFGPGKGRDG